MPASTGRHVLLWALHRMHRTVGHVCRCAKRSIRRLLTQRRYSLYATASYSDISESPAWPAAWAHFRLCALFLAAGFAWAFNLIVFATFGINWQLIFGNDIAGLVDLSAATISRVCVAALLWLWVCVAMFVQTLADAADAGRVGEDGHSLEGVLVWPQLASFTIVGSPLLLLLLPLPAARWRSRLAWLAMAFKMMIVPFTEAMSCAPCKCNNGCIH
jgi:hypothetical protein